MEKSLEEVIGALEDIATAESERNIKLDMLNDYLETISGQLAHIEEVLKEK